MGWSSSVCVWGQSSTDVSPLVLWLYSSVQYSVHRFSVSRSSVKHFPERSWTVVAFPCFTVVKSFASWYALLLLFFLRCFQSHYRVLLSCFLFPFSCTSWRCCSLPCISQILQVQIASFSVFSFCRTDQEFLQWPRFFFFWRCLSRILLAVSVTAVLKVVIIESRFVSSLFMMVRGANFPPIIAWKVSNPLGSFSFSRSNLSLVCLGLLIIFRRRWKVSISKSWSLSMSALGKLRVLALSTPNRKRFLARM